MESTKHKEENLKRGKVIAWHLIEYDIAPKTASVPKENVQKPGSDV